MYVRLCIPIFLFNTPPVRRIRTNILTFCRMSECYLNDLACPEFIYSEPVEPIERERMDCSRKTTGKRYPAPFSATKDLQK